MLLILYLVKSFLINFFVTELFLIENRYKDKGTYRFEDFFWTGSGDGPDDENNPFRPKTLTEDDQYYKTKTIVTTVYIESPLSSFNEVTTNNKTKFYSKIITLKML